MEVKILEILPNETKPGRIIASFDWKANRWPYVKIWTVEGTSVSCVNYNSIENVSFYDKKTKRKL
ncbi:MAG: hypothetical protein ACFFDN_45085 [Candidatus Hodarchaeota archaeon]